MTSMGLRRHRRAIAALSLGLLATACAPAVPDEQIFTLT